MARGKTTGTSRKLTTETLVALGPQRLAQLILTQTEVDPLFARAVRMALAAKEDISSLAQMRLFLSLAESVYDRADDSNGSLGDVFRQGGEDLGDLWVRAGVLDPAALAAEILSLIEADGYGVFDGLPEAASPALGKDGRAAMRRLLLERRAALTGDERRRYDYTANWLLPALADLDDDVDAFIATVDPERRNALLNAKVAERLIAHNRAAEALEWIDTPTERSYNEGQLADLRLKALEHLAGRTRRRRNAGRFFNADSTRAPCAHG
jgi:hypothetical protein